MSVDNGGWRWQKQVIEQHFPLNKVTSTFRNNSVANGGGLDYHSQGYAIDIGGPSLMSVFDWLVNEYPQSQEIIYSPANSRQIKNGAPHLYGEPTRSDHFTHVHWAYVAKSMVLPKDQGGGASNTVPANAITDTASGVTDAGAVLSFITDPGIWKRVGLSLAAIVILFFAIRSVS